MGPGCLDPSESFGFIRGLSSDQCPPSLIIGRVVVSPGATWHVVQRPVTCGLRSVACSAHACLLWVVDAQGTVHQRTGISFAHARGNDWTQVRQGLRVVRGRRQRSFIALKRVRTFKITCGVSVMQEKSIDSMRVARITLGGFTPMRTSSGNCEADESVVALPWRSHIAEQVGPFSVLPAALSL